MRVNKSRGGGRWRARRRRRARGRRQVSQAFRRAGISPRATCHEPRSSRAARPSPRASSTGRRLAVRSAESALASAEATRDVRRREARERARKPDPAGQRNRGLRHLLRPGARAGERAGLSDVRGGERAGWSSRRGARRGGRSGRLEVVVDLLSARGPCASAEGGDGRDRRLGRRCDAGGPRPCASSPRLHPGLGARHRRSSACGLILGRCSIPPRLPAARPPLPRRRPHRGLAGRRGGAGLRSGALFRENGEWAVFVVEDGARADAAGHARRADDAATAQVSSRGSRPGETVILHASDRIVEGAAVTAAGGVSRSAERQNVARQDRGLAEGPIEDRPAPRARRRPATCAHSRCARRGCPAAHSCSMAVAACP